MGGDAKRAELLNTFIRDSVWFVWADSRRSHSSRCLPGS